MTLELDENRILNQVIFDPYIKDNQVVYSFVYKPRSDYQFTFIAKNDVAFTQLTNIENLTRIVISVNNSVVFDGTVLSSPLTIYQNDEVKVRVYKNFLVLGKFTLIGSTI
jgi:hypothetical protein